MNLSQLMEQIEGTWFSAYINAASGLSVVKMEFESNELLEKLTNELQHSPQNKQFVFQRLLDLLPQNDEPEYAHPHDVALAAYLEVLNRIDAGLTGKAIEHILQTPRLWWARRLAKHILETPVANPK
jgi:hypothetical protein